MAWIRACGGGGGKTGYIVTYHIDTDTVITKPVRYADDCIENAPAAELPGLTLLGWRLDDIASATVLPEKACDSDDIHLYAVFSKTITVSYNGNGNTSGSVSDQTGTYYYNNGNENIPSFTLANNGYAKTNYTFSDWSKGSTSGTRYEAGATVSLSENTTFYAFWFATVTNFNYSGAVASYTVQKTGTYKLEAYGAKGVDKGGAGGLGGYARGNVALTKGQMLYVCVGGTNGYNGGGDWNNPNPSDGFSNPGAGCTHIAKTTNRGFLSAYNSYRSEVLIVAGGGGSGQNNDAGNTWTGGAGGGATGGNSSNCTSPGYGYYGYGGGTGNYNQAFGQGGGGGNAYHNANGGGGWTGGSPGNYNTGGGGGSGYTGGCISGTTTMSTGVRSGHGAAVITFVA